MRLILSLLKIVVGMIMIVAAFPVQASWFVFCFGTVIVGLIIFFGFPVLMLAPFLFLWVKGWGLVADGLEEIGFRASSDDVLAESFEMHNAPPSALASEGKDEQISVDPFIQKMLSDTEVDKELYLDQLWRRASIYQSESDLKAEQFSADPFIQKMINEGGAIFEWLLPGEMPDGYVFEEKGFFGNAFSPVIQGWYNWRVGKLGWRLRLEKARPRSPKALFKLERKYNKTLVKSLEWDLWVRADEYERNGYDN